MNFLPLELQSEIFKFLDDGSIINYLIANGPSQERPRLTGSYSVEELQEIQDRLEQAWNSRINLNEIVNLRRARLYTLFDFPADWDGIDVRRTVQIGDFEFSLDTTTIELHDQGLSDLPTEIRFLDQLQKLYLNRNYLSSFPNVFLPDLEVLNLENNWISDFPNLENFPSLKYLNLKNNSISELPSFLTHSRLQYLNLAENPISRIPYYEFLRMEQFIIDF